MSAPQLREREQELDQLGDLLAGSIDRWKEKRARRRRAIVGGAAGLMVAAGIAFVGLSPSGRNGVAPASAAEVLQRASTAVDATPGPLTDGQYYYTDSVFSYGYLMSDSATGKEFHWNARVDEENLIAPGKPIVRLERMPQPVFPSAADRSAWEQLDKPLIHVTNSKGQFDEDEHIQTKQSAQLAVSGAGPWYRLSPEGVNVDVGVQPRPSGLGDKIATAYGMSIQRLKELSGQKTRFRDYVLSHVRDITRSLGSGNENAATLDRDVNQATFSLVMELYSLGNGQVDSQLDAALLDLGSHLDGLEFSNTVDALGRPGIKIAIRTAGEKPLAAAVFDPDSFLLTELQFSPTSIDSLGLGNEPGKLASKVNPQYENKLESFTLDYQYGISNGFDRPKELLPRITAPCELRPYC